MPHTTAATRMASTISASVLSIMVRIGESS